MDEESTILLIFDCDWSISYSYSLIHTATAYCRPRITFRLKFLTVIG